MAKTNSPAPETASPPLRLEWRSPAELAENPRNWRTHPPAQIAALTDVIAEVGWAGACLFNERTERLIDGHARKKVAIEQGAAKVPVLVGDWTEEQEAMILATLDPLAGMAEAHPAKLEALLKEASTASEALQEMLADLAKANPPSLPAPGDGGDDFDATPADDGPTRCQPGDLWIIGGKHRLLCGDSTRADDVARVMGGDKAALCATDPPYLVDYTGDRPNDSGKDWSGSYHEIEIKDADGFFRGAFASMMSVLAPHAAIYCWHAHKRSGEIQGIWRDLGILDHQQIIWVKPTRIFGRPFWHFRHEPCMMGWRQGSMPPHDGQHEHDSVWEIDWEGKSRIVGNEHPTQKPLEIFMRPMRKHTVPGDLCFEPFSGSGSQLIAAHRLGRRCYGLEIEPKFCDVILRRAEAEGLTVEKAAAPRPTPASCAGTPGQPGGQGQN